LSNSVQQRRRKKRKPEARTHKRKQRYAVTLSTEERENAIKDFIDKNGVKKAPPAGLRRTFFMKGGFGGGGGGPIAGKPKGQKNYRTKQR